MIDRITHNKYVCTIFVPYALREPHIVTAVNEAILMAANQKGIDLGGALNWEVSVVQDYKWGNEDEDKRRREGRRH